MRTSARFEALVAEYHRKASLLRLLDMPLLTRAQAEFALLNLDASREAVQEMAEAAVAIPRAWREQLAVYWGAQSFHARVFTCPAGVRHAKRVQAAPEGSEP